MVRVRTGIVCVAASILFLGTGLSGITPALWPAATFAWLGVAYLLNRPRLLGKQADGTYRPGVYCILLPYLWSAAVVDRIRRRNRKPCVLHVHGTVFFGGRSDANAIPPFIDHIVDLAAELPRADLSRRVAYESFPILEHARCSTADLVNLVRRIVDRNGVYIHCAAGRSRSAMVAACILLHSGEVASAAEAIEVVTHRQPRAALSGCQRKAVDDYCRAMRALT